MFNLRGGSIFVVGNPFNNQRRAARSVSLVGYLFQRLTIGAQTARYRSVNVVVGHINTTGSLNRFNQPRVAFVAPGSARLHCNHFGVHRKNFALFGISGRFLVFDFAPLVVSGHGEI